MTATSLVLSGLELNHGRRRNVRRDCESDENASVCDSCIPSIPGNESRTTDYDDLSQHARKAQRRECYRLDRNLR